MCVSERDACDASNVLGVLFMHFNASLYNIALYPISIHSCTVTRFVHPRKQTGVCDPEGSALPVDELTLVGDVVEVR